MHSWLRALLAMAFAAGVWAPGRAATDLTATQAAEIEALQHRLTDAKCYAGAIDGQASADTAEAVKACPSQEPVLRIETGMHVARINRIGVDAGCKLLATESYDKTVRLWSLPEGRLLRTIRLPIAEGEGGKVDEVALSLDGRTLAAGGWDAGYEKGKGMALYVVDLAAGRVQRFGAFEGVIGPIAFSTNGARVGVGLGGAKGVRVLDRLSGRELLADRDYGSQVTGLAFGPDGSLVASSFDGLLRRYGPDLTLTVKVKAPGGPQPYGVAIDAAGHRVAVGYNDTNAVSILDAATLKPMAQAETGDLTNGAFFSLTWTADGRQLVAGGSARQSVDGGFRPVLRRFSPLGNRIGVDAAAADNVVLDLKPCGADIAFATADPSFGLMSADARVWTLQRPVTADMRNKLGDAFTVSPDATSVRFGLGLGGTGPVLFDLAAGTLSDSFSVPSGLLPATVQGLPVTDWENNVAPKLGGVTIPLDQYEPSRSLAVRTNRTGFVLGTEWYLRALDSAGKERWKKPSPGTAWGVNLGAEGRVVVAAYGDGTIRWHRWSDGQELLALFVHKDTKAWVAWTPTGYYLASPSGEDMIGWHVNRGWEQEADFFPASRFRDRFSRPDIVRLVLTTLDEGEAVKQADAAAHRRADGRSLIARLPPVLTILSPTEGAEEPPGAIKVRYATRLPSGGTLDRVEAFVDGAKVEVRGLARVDAGATTDGGATGTIALPMPAHDAAISLVAYAGNLASDAARVQLKGVAPAGRGSAAEEDALKPSLYALLVGVTHYRNKTFDLAYAAADATALAEALRVQKGWLYKDVQVRVLTDKDATSTAVKLGLLWLQEQTTSRDLAVVFASGHGMTDAKGKFWFMTTDADPGKLLATAVSQEDISSVLFDLPGKKLVLLDACHAGAALNPGTKGLERTDISAALNDFAQAEGGVVAYAASTGREFSFERAEWGHGAFTKALIEGFGGKADLLHKGTVTTATLDAFLANRVKELTGGQQHPVMTRPKTVPDFPIALVQ